jgi:hypothetical protein
MGPKLSCLLCLYEVLRELQMINLSCYFQSKLPNRIRTLLSVSVSEMLQGRYCMLIQWIDLSHHPYKFPLMAFLSSFLLVS